ncbi:hypothetical protein BS50DRAFT_576599 [Corynespora cassiicola Philippines]|uniref:Uncharacterized protein n=1 Tax=Corynespora cassiicola Philippines TaxID=1448308 RepID=A0A2T2NEU9_CORCC|nr:hypothetical protein BS50DRAFT_576599 [Corynespora cassiicola Philippines]
MALLFRRPSILSRQKNWYVPMPPPPLRHPLPRPSSQPLTPHIPTHNSREISTPTKMYT